MSVDDRVELVLRGSEEVVTREELQGLLEVRANPRAYVGLEPSGLLHLGTGFIVASKVSDLVRAGFHTIIFLADWHAYINDKLGGDLTAIRACGEYFKDGFRALGVPPEVEFLYANEFVSNPEYWKRVLEVSKASSVARIRRALTVMGRNEKDADLDASKLVYPAMQVADIRWMDLDLAYGGMDQRHAHMLYRDLAPKLGWKRVIALHTPLVPGLQGGGRMDPVDAKMSKSKPDSGIFLNDSSEDVDRKLAKAYCPPKETKDNPVIEISRMILFPRRGSIEVPREAKFGGDVVYTSYRELSAAYARAELHPQDLKRAVAAGLNRELEPVRRYFETHPDSLEALRTALRGH